MTRPIARKKLRNPKLKTTRRRANAARNKKFTGHPLLRDMWDSSLTMAENYRNLGLVARLNGEKGGQVTPLFGKAKEEADEQAKVDMANMTNDELRKHIPQGYGIIERDDDGNVINIIMPEEPQDPLDSDYEAEKVEAKKEGARALEEYANMYHEKKQRWLAQGERQMLQDFIDAHGDDYNKMFWDKKLNIDQLTEKQIKKKIQRYLSDKEKALGPYKYD
ncbi:Nucleolar protein 16 [Linderina pennispora]|nr:Nucleolar protein 16 [Linderina pennispora]